MAQEADDAGVRERSTAAHRAVVDEELGGRAVGRVDDEIGAGEMRRQIVLVDLSSLTYQDAAFVGTLFTSMYFSAARRRQPLPLTVRRNGAESSEAG